MRQRPVRISYRLAIPVGLAAALIAVFWVVLFRNGVLAPPLVMPRGPSLVDVSREFTKTISEFQAATERATQVPATASDDVRTPSAP